VEAMFTWAAVGVMSTVAAVMYAGRRRALPVMHRAAEQPSQAKERVLSAR